MQGLGVERHEGDWRLQPAFEEKYESMVCMYVCIICIVSTFSRVCYGSDQPGKFANPARMYVCICMVITYNKSMDQPGKVANPARG